MTRYKVEVVISPENSAPSKWHRVGRHQGEKDMEERLDNLLELHKQEKQRIGQL